MNMHIALFNAKHERSQIVWNDYLISKMETVKCNELLDRRQSLPFLCHTVYFDAVMHFI